MINKNFTKIRILIDILLKSQFTYKKPKLNPIAIFGGRGDAATIFFDYVDKSKTTVLNLVTDEISLYIVWLCIIKNKSYYQEYVDYLNPQILLTFYDNSTAFLFIKAPRECCKISVQNGARSELHDLFSSFTTIKKNILSNDYIFVFNDAVAKEYNKFIPCQSYSIGSFRSNRIKVLNIEKELDILYVSTYREWYSIPNQDIVEGVTWGEYIKNELIFIRWLFRYASKNNIKLNIIGSSAVHSVKEYDFYQELSNGTMVNFIPKVKNRDTYKIIDSAKMIVSIDSTLGYEALARGLRVAMVAGIRGNKYPLNSRRFGGPKIYPDTGNFWEVSLDKNKWNRVLDYTYTSSEETWGDNFPLINDVMKYNDQNKKFSDVIDKVLTGGGRF